MGEEGGGEGETKQMFLDCKNSCLVNNINPRDFKHTLKFAYQELKEHKKARSLVSSRSPTFPLSSYFLLTWKEQRPCYFGSDTFFCEDLCLFSFSDQKINLYGCV